MILSRVLHATGLTADTSLDCGESGTLLTAAAMSRARRAGRYRDFCLTRFLMVVFVIVWAVAISTTLNTAFAFVRAHL
jgi:hypothetical protein